MKPEDTKGEPLILVVEDREDDVVLIRKAFDRAKISNPLQVVRDGEEAIAYLSGLGKFSNRPEYPLPWLVLLDLKMPRMDGFQVLEWIRQQSGLHSTIVVVLTSSDQMRDVNQAYRLGANSFMIKPLDFENAVGLMKMIRDYWMMHNRFPEVERPPRKKMTNGA